MTKHTRENLSQYVQRILRQKKLSLADVERNSDKEITSSYISRIIKGTVTNLSVERIVALARGLDVDPHEIFTVSVGQPPGNAADKHRIDPAVFVDTVHKLLINPELLELFQLLGGITNKEREALILTLRYIDKSQLRSRSRRRS